MKTAYVLSGGGAKGAFQVGVMERLITDMGIVPDVVYGTSVGALNAAGYAYVGLDGLRDVWLSIKSRKDILSRNYLSVLWATGMYSMKPLRKILEKSIAGDARCEAVSCWVSLTTGEIGYTSNKVADRTAFIDAVEASACIPYVMETVGSRIDGGCREQAPLKKAIVDGADRIIVILCNPIRENPEYEWKMPTGWFKWFKIGMRALDVMEHEVFVNDIKRCIAYNEDPERKQIDLKFYAPDRTLLDTLDFEPDKIQAALEQGRMAVL